MNVTQQCQLVSAADYSLHVSSNIRRLLDTTERIRIMHEIEKGALEVYSVSANSGPANDGMTVHIRLIAPQPTPDCPAPALREQVERVRDTVASALAMLDAILQGDEPPACVPDEPEEPTCPDRLPNGAFTIAYYRPDSESANAYVLAWWPKDGGEFVSWQANVSKGFDDTYAGRYSGKDFQKACKDFCKRTGLSKQGLNRLLDRDCRAVNLDALDDDELDSIWDGKRPNLPRFYTEYASLTLCARKARVKGCLEQAARLEQQAQDVYNVMPEPFKW